jgi:ribonuclease HI
MNGLMAINNLLTWNFKLKTLNIIIYTDGAARGNPGPGGYGTVLLSGQFRKELSDGFELTTNNRMELLAVIVGLEALMIENSQVTIYSDSKYVVDAVEKGWIWNWVKIRFKGKKNQDLWLRFLKIYPKHQVKFVWVKGHANIPENERCDQLAVAASMQPRLKKDSGYLASL